MPTRFLINQCQIITFLILKYDIIENSRIELRGIVLPVQVGGLLGGGPKGILPPSQIIGGPGPPAPPPPPPSSYAYVEIYFKKKVLCEDSIPLCIIVNSDLHISILVSCVNDIFLTSRQLVNIFSEILLGIKIHVNAW